MTGRGGSPVGKAGETRKGVEPEQDWGKRPVERGEVHEASPRGEPEGRQGGAGKARHFRGTAVVSYTSSAWLPIDSYIYIYIYILFMCGAYGGNCVYAEVMDYIPVDCYLCVQR